MTTTVHEEHHEHQEFQMIPGGQPIGMPYMPPPPYGMQMQPGMMNPGMMPPQGYPGGQMMGQPGMMMQPGMMQQPGYGY